MARTRSQPWHHPTITISTTRNRRRENSKHNMRSAETTTINVRCSVIIIISRRRCVVQLLSKSKALVRRMKSVWFIIMWASSKTLTAAAHLTVNKTNFNRNKSTCRRTQMYYSMAQTPTTWGLPFQTSPLIHWSTNTKVINMAKKRRLTSFTRASITVITISFYITCSHSHLK